MSAPVNLFQQVHRSIFDPVFYREVPGFGRRAIFLYVIKLVLIASVFSAVAHTWHVFGEKRGTAAAIAAAMKGIAIKEGRLVSDRPLPYEIPATDLAAIYRCFLPLPAAIDTLQMPRVIVDTSANHPVRTIPSIILRSSDMAFYSAPGEPQLFPYFKKSWYGPLSLDFSESRTKEVLKKAVIFIFLLNLAWDGLSSAGLVLFCICMLGFAAYIFRIERSRGISDYFGIAAFAVTPLPVGMIIIALSDVHFPGSWHFLVIMSVVVMFRALMAAAKPTNEAGPGGEQ